MVGRAVVHDLQLTQYLLSDGRLRINENELQERASVVRDQTMDAQDGLMDRTFRAMKSPLGPWRTLVTVPPLPQPSSPTTLRSSGLSATVVLPLSPPRCRLAS